MNEIYSKQVIVCEKGRRGDAKETPIRILREVFDMDGTIIAELDPYSLSIEQVLDFLRENELLTGAVNQAFRSKFIR